MAPRAHWKGYLKLSLVSCPIALYPAVSAAERISFRQVNKQTGNRLRHQLVDSITGDVVGSSEKARGYEVGQNQFLMVEDAELEAAQQQARQKPSRAEQAPRAAILPEEAPRPREEAPRGAAPKAKVPLGPAVTPSEPVPPPVRVENNRTIEIERCVSAAAVDARYHDTPYYIAPRDEVGVEAFALIRDAMLKKEFVGLGHVVLARRERPIMVTPFDKGLVGVTLRYAHEIRNADEYFAAIPDVVLPDEMLQVAEHILEMKAADFDAALLEDRYRTVLVSMLKEKQAQLPERVAMPATPSSRNVINLMDALKRSLATDQAAVRGPAKSMPRRGAGRKAPASKRSSERAGKTR